MTPDTRLLFGLPLDAMTMTDVVDRCAEHLQTRKRLQIGVVNAAKIVTMRRDLRLRESLLACDILLADGQAVVWASKILRRSLPERVAGIDLFTELLNLAAREDYGVYLLGAKPEVLASLQQHLLADLPTLRIAGARDGYFSTAESADVATGIAASGADLVFLGMTSPKKEIFLDDYADALGAPILHGVGGSFDVLAGLTKRAPERWQRLGLEWFYRFLQEPRRMWRRYLSTNTAFLLLLVREIVVPTKAYRADTTPRGSGQQASGQQESGQNHEDTTRGTK